MKDQSQTENNLLILGVAQALNMSQMVNMFPNMSQIVNMLPNMSQIVNMFPNMSQTTNIFSNMSQMTNMEQAQVLNMSQMTNMKQTQMLNMETLDNNMLIIQFIMINDDLKTKKISYQYLSYFTFADVYILPIRVKCEGIFKLEYYSAKLRGLWIFRSDLY